MNERAWYVVGSMTGLRVEQHPHAPDNALYGPYASGDEAVERMRKESNRDRKEMLAAWVISICAGATLLAWLGWVIIKWAV